MSRLFRRPPAPPRRAVRWIPTAPTASSSIELAATEAADTFAGAVDLDIGLSLAATEASDTFAGEIDLDLDLELAATEGSDTFAGTLELVGLSVITLAATEASDTFSGAIDLDAEIALDATDGADTFAGALLTGNRELELGATEGSDTFTGAMTAHGAPSTSGGRARERDPRRRVAAPPPVAKIDILFRQPPQDWIATVEVSDGVDLDEFEQDEGELELSFEVSSTVTLGFDQDEQAFDAFMKSIDLRAPAAPAQTKAPSYRLLLEFEQGENFEVEAL